MLARLNKQEKPDNKLVAETGILALPTVTLQHVARFLTDREKYQFSKVSKSCYKTIKTMPPLLFKMEEINGIKVKKVIYDELTKERVQYVVYDEMYGEEEAPMFYLSLKADLEKPGHHRLFFSEFIYENPSLIYAMLEDSGFRKLLKNSCPGELLLKPKMSFLKKFRNSILLGSVGLLSSIMACALLLPVAIFFTALGYLTGCLGFACAYPTRPRLLGLPALFSPLTILCSTVAAVSIGFYTPLSWCNVKDFFSNAFVFMYDWCFSPYNYGYPDFRTTWNESWLATKVRTFEDVASDYRENELEKIKKLILPSSSPAAEPEKSSYARILSRSLHADPFKVMSEGCEKSQSDEESAICDTVTSPLLPEEEGRAEFSYRP